MNDTTFQGDGKIAFVPVVVNAKQHPQTNADRIRQMSDAELAEWVKLMVCKYRSCGNCPMSDWCTPKRGIAEWLKSPVEVEE